MFTLFNFGSKGERKKLGLGMNLLDLVFHLVFVGHLISLLEKVLRSNVSVLESMLYKDSNVSTA